MPVTPAVSRPPAPPATQTPLVIGRVATLIVAIAISACGKGPSTGNSTQTPRVTVAEVVTRTVPQQAEFIASTTPVRSVTLRARVTGYLQKRLFTEGATISEGDLLYVIDPSEYQAQLKRAQGELAKGEAALVSLDTDLKRYQKLRRKQDVSEQTLDSIIAKQKEAQAQVASDQAMVDQAQLNLDYTQVHAPLNGRIGDTRVNVGNLVGPSENAELATIVQLDPIYVMFRPGGSEMSAIVEQQRKAPVAVSVTLPDRSGGPYRGSIDFIDNRVDPTTSTLRMRATIANPDGRLLPGQFARVRIDLGRQPGTTLVPQAALVENQGGFLLYVVAADDKVQLRNVSAGAVHNGLREVSATNGSSITAGERVIVAGVQRVHAGMKVETRPADASNDTGPGAKR